jgi:hypothetical protein
MAEEARAQHVVGAPACDRLEDPREVGRVVLAVAVEVDGGGVALVARDAEPEAKSGPEAARDRVRVDPSAMLACDLRRGVARAVVDEQDVHGKPARLGRQPREHTAHGLFLVARNDNGEASRGALRRPCAGPGPRFPTGCPA